MKIIIFSVALIALLCVSYASVTNAQQLGTFAGATRGFARQFCDPAKPGFSDRHAWFISTLAKNRIVGGVVDAGWEQDTQFIIPNANGDYVTQYARYTWYQDNYYNRNTCSFNSLQAWPEMNLDGSFFGFVLQEVEVRIQLPFTQPKFKVHDDDEDDERRQVEAPSIYNISWKTSMLPQSLLIKDSYRTEVALDARSGCISWSDPVSKRVLLNECLTTVIPGELRLYSLNAIIEGYPGVPASSFIGWNTFRSTAKPLPVYIKDAFNKYYAGQLTKRPPPSCPTCEPVYVYPIPPQVRSENATDFSKYTSYVPSTHAAIQSFIRSQAAK